MYYGLIHLIHDVNPSQLALRGGSVVNFADLGGYWVALSLSFRQVKQELRPLFCFGGR